MRKKLTALVLSALPLAAVADVSLYGEIKAGVEGRNYQLQLTEAQAANGGAGASGQVKVTKAKSRIRTKISDFGSFIGFKGSEDLGEGLKAVWQLEQDVSVAGGGATQWGNRESFIGLAGEFGTLRAGRVANQFDDASQAIDPWDSNNDVASQLGIFKRHDDMPVSVRYDSPDFSGFSGSVQFVPAQNSKSAYVAVENGVAKKVAAVVGKPGSDVYYAGLNYKNGGFAGNYAFKYAKHANVGRDAFELFLLGSGSDQAKGTDPLKNHQVHRLTGGYEEGGLNLALAAQLDLSENADKTKNSTTEIAATASYRFGNAVPRISYAHGFDFIERGKKGENTSYDQIIAGVDYDFSKRTSAIVSGAWLKRNTGIGNYTQINAASVGLRHKF
ncbi:TPA: porin [Neisseria meningitidis]